MISPKLSSAKHVIKGGDFAPFIVKNSITGRRIIFNFSLVIPLKSIADKLATIHPFESTTQHASDLVSNIFKKPSIARSSKVILVIASMNHPERFCFDSEIEDFSFTSYD